MAGAVINVNTVIGDNCIINTRCSIDHDCYISKSSHIAPGAAISGTVRLGNGVHIGTGASVIDDITIGEWAYVQAAAHHLVEHGQEGLDLLLAVHDLDHQRQVHREPEDFGGVQAAGLAEAHRPAQDRGAGQVQLARLQDDGFVERLVFPAVAFADEDSQQNRFVWNLHI